MTRYQVLRTLLAAALLAVPACDKKGTRTPSLKKANTNAATWPALTDPLATVQNPALRDAAVVVAIEDYSFVDDIPGAKANAAAWVEFLVKTQGIPEQHVHLLWNYEASKGKILEYAQQATQDVAPGGKLWFVFIGHGAPNQQGNDAWLLGADVRRNPDSIVENGVSQRELIAMLERPGNVTPVVVLDACFNGRTGSGDRLLEEGLQDLMFVDLTAGSNAVVLSASGKDEYAGSLPGLSRPAFSYLMLGAMRGWGDENHDGTVTVDEAVGYSRGVLGTLLKGRKQSPEIVGGRGGEVPLAISSGEVGPDLTEMRLRGAAANDSEINADLLHVPDPVLQSSDVVFDPDGSVKADIEAERLYGEAIKIQNDEKVLPETKASKWCELARKNDETNPYRIQGLKMCREWQVYARALRQKESALLRDYAYLREYLELDHKTHDQKMAAVAAFLTGYADMSSDDYPHVREVEKAQKKLERKQDAKMPSLSKVELIPVGSPSTQNPTTNPTATTEMVP